MILTTTRRPVSVEVTTSSPYLLLGGRVTKRQRVLCRRTRHINPYTDRTGRVVAAQATVRIPPGEWMQVRVLCCPRCLTVLEGNAYATPTATPYIRTAEGSEPQV